MGGLRGEGQSCDDGWRDLIGYRDPSAGARMAANDDLVWGGVMHGTRGRCPEYRDAYDFTNDIVVFGQIVMFQVRLLQYSG